MHRRLASQFADSLRRYILAHGLGPGDQIPSERHIAATFGVSRHVVREAIGALEAQGILSISQGRRALVREPPDATSLPRAIPPPREQEPNPDWFALELRSVFEAGIAELVVERITTDELRQLDAIVEAMRQVVDAGHHAAEEDLAFHHQFLLGAHNPVVAATGQSVVLGYIRDYIARAPTLSPGAMPEQADVDEHRTIVAAIRARDVELLRRIMRFHGYPMDHPGRLRSGLLPYWLRL